MSQRESSPKSSGIIWNEICRTFNKGWGIVDRCFRLIQWYLLLVGLIGIWRQTHNQSLKLIVTVLFVLPLILGVMTMMKGVDATHQHILVRWPLLIRIIAVTSLFLLIVVVMAVAFWSADGFLRALVDIGSNVQEQAVHRTGKP